MKSGPTVTPISTLAELETQCQRIHEDGIFGSGVVAVALGLFIPKEKESGEVVTIVVVVVGYYCMLLLEFCYCYYCVLLLCVVVVAIIGCTWSYCPRIHFFGC